MISRSIVVFAAGLCALAGDTMAFVHISPGFVRMESSLSATNPCDRRDAFFGMASAVVAGMSVGMVSNPQPATAKYSDYSRREKDWEERKKNGEIKVSTARDLRKQLAEIVPENNEGSKVFCPNGPSAAVSPLMENKCSDIRMAIPSVYGRSSDVVGNSIPGFQAGYSVSSGDRSSIASSVGGFPGYYSK